MSANDTDIYENIRQQAHLWRARASAGNLTAAEQQEFEAWRQQSPRHELAYDQSVTFYSALGEVDWDKFDNGIFRPLLRERFVRTYGQLAKWVFSAKGLIATGAAAASAAVFIVLIAPSFWSQDPSPTLQVASVIETYSTAKNDILEIDLSDGSRVTLGAGSEIETAFSETARTVTLISGAALFDVTKDQDRPFSVKAGELTATVLGTQFDVRNSGGIHRVAVAEGEVRITYPYVIDDVASSLRSNRELKAGEQVSATFEDGLSGTSTVELADVGAWRDRRLIYKRATISELISDARRYDDRDILIEAGSEDIADLRLSGSFSGDDVDNMLLTLQDIHPIQVDISSPSQIILKRVIEP